MGQPVTPAARALPLTSLTSAAQTAPWTHAGLASRRQRYQQCWHGPTRYPAHRPPDKRSVCADASALLPAAVGVLWQFGSRDPTPPGGPRCIEAVAGIRKATGNGIGRRKSDSRRPDGRQPAIWMAAVLAARSTAMAQAGGTFSDQQPTTNDAKPPAALRSPTSSTCRRRHSRP